MLYLGTVLLERSVNWSDFDENADPSSRNSDSVSKEESNLTDNLNLESKNESGLENDANSMNEDMNTGEVNGMVDTRNGHEN